MAHAIVREAGREGKKGTEFVNWDRPRATWDRLKVKYGPAVISGTGHVSRRWHVALDRVRTSPVWQSLPRWPGSGSAPLAVSFRPAPTLVVLISTARLADYERAGRLAHLTGAFERYRAHYRRVLVVSRDSRRYDGRMVDGVEHVRLPLRLPLWGGLALALVVIIRFRTLRKATGVIALDGPAGVAGWIAGRLSGAPSSISLGAPWSPPTGLGDGASRVSRWLGAAGVRRVARVSLWPGADMQAPPGAREYVDVGEWVNTDLFTPLETTDPGRPERVVAFLDVRDPNVTGLVIGAAHELRRVWPRAEVKAVATGGRVNAAAVDSLQAEAELRESPVEFVGKTPQETMPHILPRSFAALVPGTNGLPAGALEAMSSGVPCIVAGIPQDENWTEDAIEERWRKFSLPCTADASGVVTALLMLHREPEVRMRLAREARRFVQSQYSLEAAVRDEVSALGHYGVFEQQDKEQDEKAVAGQKEFDWSEEAEKLSDMLTALGVTKDDDSDGAASGGGAPGEPRLAPPPPPPEQTGGLAQETAA